MSYIITCPYCSTQVRVSDRSAQKTLICPRCLADLNNADPISQIASAEIETGVRRDRSARQIRAADINTDVKRDVSVGSIILAVLIGLCVLGSALALLIPAPREEYGVVVNAMFLLLFFAALDVLVSVAIIRGLVRWGISGVRSPSAGRVIGITFLSLGTIVAICIFFFFTCWGLMTLKAP